MALGVGVFDELTCFPLSRLRERVPSRSEGGRGKSPGEFAHSPSKTGVNALVAFAALSHKREREERSKRVYADESM